MKRVFCVLLAGFLAGISGCGQSGGSGDIVHSGSSELAQLNSTSAALAAESALSASLPSVPLDIDAVVAAEGAARIAPAVGSMVASAAKTLEKTIDGDSGGSATLSLSMGEGGAFSGSLSFSGYSDSRSTGGDVENGVLLLSGTVSKTESGCDLALSAAISGILTTSKDSCDRAFTGGWTSQKSFWTNGSTGAEEWSSETVVNLAAGPVKNAGSIKYENLTVSEAMSGGVLETSVEGRIHIGSLGYADVSTVSPLTGSSGEVEISGKNGSALLLTFSGEGATVKIETGDDIPPAFDDGTVFLPN